MAWIDEQHRTLYRRAGAVRAPFAERRMSALRWSPDGGYLIADATPPPRGPAPPDGRVVPIGSWAYAPDTGESRLIYAAPPIQNALGDWSPSFYCAGWSPDGRFMAIRKVPIVSASLQADGLPLSLIEVANGVETPLGTTLLYPWLAWRAPHTLAYIAGGDRFTWDHKTLRVWTPETGLRDLTGSDEIALAPTWSIGFGYYGAYPALASFAWSR